MVNAKQNVSLDAWRRTTESALDLGRKGDTRGALAILQRGIETARSAGEKRGEVILLNGVALLHSIRGDFWASLAGSIDAFFLASQHEDRSGMAHATTMVAGALLLMTAVDSEIGLLQTALKIAEEERDMRLQVRIHNLLGILLGDLQRFDQAEVHLDMGMVLSECDTSGFDRWRVTANFANLLRKRAEATQDPAAREEFCAPALVLIKRVETHCSQYGKTPVLIDALRIGGMLLALKGSREAAHARFMEAWTLAHEKKHRSVLPALAIDIGRMELDCGRLNSAESTLTDGLREAAQYRPSPKAPGLCELMARLHQMRGDERGEAHWYHEAALAQKDFEALKLEARKQLGRVAECLSAKIAR